MNTKASDWFTDEREFRQLCGDAQSQARGESSQEFAAQMMIMANKHGLQTYISYKQLEWLCKIADHEIPPMRFHVETMQHIEQLRTALAEDAMTVSYRGSDARHLDFLEQLARKQGVFVKRDGNTLTISAAITLGKPPEHEVKP